MKQTFLFFALATMALPALSQPRFSQPHGLYDGGTLTIAIEGDDPEATIHYTIDGSEPTAASVQYTAPLTVSKTTILRAAEVKADTLCSAVTTASYLFVGSVLGQSNNPAGYPAEWGQYNGVSTGLWGTATADYEMDPEMTGNATLKPSIIEGLKQLPILSIVTDKDNLFSHENDEEHGGIYIFTGPPVGDPTGHGWTRPASAELFSPAAAPSAAAPSLPGSSSAGSSVVCAAAVPQPSALGHDFSVTCGLRLHGGHGRLAEKNPKHSFRLVFKEKYGPKTLKYPLFGEGEPSKFDQLVLRCHFGYAWQHWSEDNRQRAQYTRDVWARRMQRKMGHTAVNALYVHLFLNGMYWGLYNIAERVDDQFGKDHLGGKKDDIDVIKIEEDGGNHIEASEGTLDAWEEMVQTAADVATSNAADAHNAYLRLQGLTPDGVRDTTLKVLLDMDNFIDYILINQYGGNDDWDHHNWYAIRRRGADSQGFRFLCWDTEAIFLDADKDIVTKDKHGGYPTTVFRNLMHNQQFQRRYLRRAKELLADDGLLGQESVVAVWDSLYNNISLALYDEAARWGDYRRDVHQWQRKGQLYTVDGHYQAERNRLLTEYFPQRTDIVLNSILGYVNIDDFDVPDEWTPLTAAMWHEWDGTGAGAQVVNANPQAVLNLNTRLNSGNVVAGFSSVSYNLFADVSQYGSLIIRGQGDRLRILANRLTDHGDFKEVSVGLNADDPHWDANLQAVVLPLSELRDINTKRENTPRRDAFTHVNAIKVESGSATVSGLWLTPALPTDMALYPSASSASLPPPVLYSLSGQQVTHPKPGVYVRNGKVVVVR